MMPEFLHDLAVFAPEVLLLVGALIALVMGVFGTAPYEGAMRTTAVTLLGALVLLLALPADGQMSFGLHFVQTGATQFAKLWVIISALGVIALAHHTLARAQMQKFEFPVLILLSALGMCLMISARDMLALYVGIELQSLALYILASFMRQDERSAEAGLKYFVLGALSSGLLLYGISLLYGATGSIQYAPIGAFITSAAPGLPVMLALVFILAALAFKVSAAPFHMWTPDVYQGATTPVTAFLTTAPKVAGMLVIMQLLHGPLANASTIWVQILWAAAALSLIVGAFAALMQQNIKRLLAYSTINHVGFLLIAILSGGDAGYSALLVYLAVYVILSLGTFGAILYLQQQGEAAETLTDLSGLSRRRPGVALALAILMFGMAGIPPTAGFLGKLYVLMAAMQSGYVWLAALGVITSVVATFYYLRVIKIMYFEDAPTGAVQPILPTIRQSRRITAVLALTTALSAGIMIMPSLIVDPATAAAKTMVPGVAR
jgi:NADH-quinone oxidoreductase subunit N